jgi:hypothetical protein
MFTNGATYRRWMMSNHEELLKWLDKGERPGITIDRRAAAAIRELQAERDKYRDTLLSKHGGEPLALLEELDEARAERDAALLECNEQARLLGMGSEREARLMAERDALKLRLLNAETTRDMLNRMDDDGQAEIAALKAENERLRDALTWYESLLRHCGRVGIQGDAANIRLSADRGSVARAALAGGG